MGRHAGRAQPRGGRHEGVLRVDPTRCAGVGICAHLSPRLVTLDSWGYPMLNGNASPHAARDAAAAIVACPRQALFLDHPGRSPEDGRAVGSSGGNARQALEPPESRTQRRRGRYR